MKKKTKGRGKAAGRKKAVEASTRPASATAIGAVALATLMLASSIGLFILRPDIPGTPEIDASGKSSDPDEVAASVRTDLGTNLYLIALSSASGPYADADRSFVENATSFITKNYGAVGIEGHDVKVTVDGMGLAALEADTMVRGMDATVPDNYYMYVELSIDIDGRAETHIIGRPVPVIMPFIEVLHESFTDGTTTQYSHLGRMVKYMLTTLVRYRTDMGHGSGPYDTEKDVLNEGDVELAVNLALIIEEMRLLGTYDRDAVDAIDRYYYDALDPDAHPEQGWFMNNPTGLRPWGSAEENNYIRYLSRTSAHGRRTLSGILKETFDRSDEDTIRIDPSNVIALYLGLGDTRDLWLSHEGFLDRAREQDAPLKDPRIGREEGPDPASLVMTTPISNSPMKMEGPVTQNLTIAERPVTVKQAAVKDTASLIVDQYPDYLIIGQDISVTEDLADPVQFMTNVKLETGSRTGGVPPPQPQPQHDFYSLWNFNITGSFRLNIMQEELFTVAGEDLRIHLNGTVELDIPISIFAWYRLPPQNVGLDFVNLNAGSPPGDTSNFTNESIMYETFAVDVWPGMVHTEGDITALMTDLAALADELPAETYSNGATPAIVNRTVRPVEADIGAFIDDRLGPLIDAGTPLLPILIMDYLMYLDIDDDGALVITTDMRSGTVTTVLAPDGHWDIEGDLDLGHATVSFRYTDDDALTATVQRDDGVIMKVGTVGGARSFTITGGGA